VNPGVPASLWQEEDEDSVIQGLPAVVCELGHCMKLPPGFDTALLRSSHTTCCVLICLFPFSCRFCLMDDTCCELQELSACVQ
jgi:hypothetical protein